MEKSRAGIEDERRKEVCPICQGLGYVRAHVPVDHPDFGKLAEAFGVPSLKVESRDDIEAAVARAREHLGGPFLIEFVVVQEEAVFPMVPAGAALHDGVLVGDRLLADSCEGVELPHHPDDGLAAAPRGDEGGGHPRDAPLHMEAMFLHLFGEELGGLVFQEADLRVLPSLVADVYDALLVLVDPAECDFL